MGNEFADYKKYLVLRMIFPNNKGNFLLYDHKLHETDYCVVYKGLYCLGDEENDVVWNIYNKTKLHHSQEETLQDKVK